jgi:hypothetical protein
MIVYYYTCIHSESSSYYAVRPSYTASTLDTAVSPPQDRACPSPRADRRRHRVLVDSGFEGGDASDQVFGGGVAMVVREILTEPVPQCLHRHQVGAIAGQRRQGDPQAGGGGPHGFGPVIRRPILDHAELAMGDLGPQAAQDVNGVFAIGARIRPDPYLAFVVEIQAVE